MLKTVTRALIHKCDGLLEELDAERLEHIEAMNEITKQTREQFLSGRSMYVLYVPPSAIKKKFDNNQLVITLQNNVQSITPIRSRSSLKRRPRSRVTSTSSIGVTSDFSTKKTEEPLNEVKQHEVEHNTNIATSDCSSAEDDQTSTKTRKRRTVKRKTTTKMTNNSDANVRNSSTSSTTSVLSMASTSSATSFASCTSTCSVASTVSDVSQSSVISDAPSDNSSTTQVRSRKNRPNKGRARRNRAVGDSEAKEVVIKKEEQEKQYIATKKQAQDKINSYEDMGVKNEEIEAVEKDQTSVQEKHSVELLENNGIISEKDLEQIDEQQQENMPNEQIQITYNSATSDVEDTVRVQEKPAEEQPEVTTVVLEEKREDLQQEENEKTVEEKYKRVSKEQSNNLSLPLPDQEENTKNIEEEQVEATNNDLNVPMRKASIKPILVELESNDSEDKEEDDDDTVLILPYSQKSSTSTLRLSVPEKKQSTPLQRLLEEKDEQETDEQETDEQETRDDEDDATIDFSKTKYYMGQRQTNDPINEKKDEDSFEQQTVTAPINTFQSESTSSSSDLESESAVTESRMMDLVMKIRMMKEQSEQQQRNSNPKENSNPSLQSISSIRNSKVDSMPRSSLSKKISENSQSSTSENNSFLQQELKADNDLFDLNQTFSFINSDANENAMLMSPEPSRKSSVKNRDRTPPTSQTNRSTPPARHKSKRASTPASQHVSSPPKIGHGNSKSKAHTFLSNDVKEIIDEIEPTTPSTASVQAYFDSEHALEASTNPSQYDNAVANKSTFLSKSNPLTSSDSNILGKRKLEVTPTFDNNKRTKLSEASEPSGNDEDRLSISSNASTSSNISSASSQPSGNLGGFFNFKSLVNNITATTFSFLSKSKPQVPSVASGKTKMNIKALKQAEKSKQKEEIKAQEKARQKEEAASAIQRQKEEARKKLHEKAEMIKKEREQKKLAEQKKLPPPKSIPVPTSNNKPNIVAKTPVSTDPQPLVKAPSGKNIVSIKLQSQILQQQQTPQQFNSKNVVYNVPKPEVGRESVDSVSSTYELSDGVYTSSEDEDEIQRRRAKKKIPRWAQGDSLQDLVQRSSKMDPDLIFGPVKPLQLEEVFREHLSRAETQKRIRARTSSQNWSRDTYTTTEEQAYKREMGFQ